MTSTAPLIIPPSDRLCYRLMGPDDADILFELDQDPEVMRFLNDSKPTPQKDFDEIFMPRFMAFTSPATGSGLWAMEDKDSGDFLGWILVRDYGFSTDYHTPGIIELGWRLKRAYWGQGLTTEAAQAIIDVLKTNPENRRFCALADVDNLTSIGVMKKLGMQFIDNRVHVTPKANLPVAYYEMPSPL